MNRRDFLVGSSFAIISGALAHCRAAYGSEDDPDYVDHIGPLPKYRMYGNDPALPKEVKEAIRIFSEAAKLGDSPLRIAQFFERLEDRNDDREYYRAAWANRWNPVIVGFYKTAKLDDKYILTKGDTIPWCAAFVNWCLGTIGLPTTPDHRASSGSFRKYGALTKDPKPGDIVVFKHVDPKEADKGKGHVGFFVGFDGDKIKVLGGNQHKGKKYSSVNTALFSESSKSLVLHSFRSIRPS